MVVDGDKIYAGGAFAVIGGLYHAHLSAFPTQDLPVATLLAQFDATPAGDAIELRWSFGDASRVASVIVERALATAGPWLAITPELRNDGDVTTAIDRTAAADATYFYRLRVSLGGWFQRHLRSGFIDCEHGDRRKLAEPSRCPLR